MTEEYPAYLQALLEESPLPEEMDERTLRKFEVLMHNTRFAVWDRTGLEKVIRCLIQAQYERT